MKKSVALFSLGFVLLFAEPGHAQEPLKFFKNYFITGDYVVRGTSLWRRGVNGKAVVDIPRLADIPKLGGVVDAGVPSSADIVAAFLYIQTAEKIQGSGIDRVKFGATQGRARRSLVTILVRSTLQVRRSRALARSRRRSIGIRRRCRVGAFYSLEEDAD